MWEESASGLPALAGDHALHLKKEDTMNSKTAVILLMILPVVWFSGCETVKEHKGAAAGAGVGAATGVILGGDTKGRLVGGLLGALIGGAIGHYAIDRQLNRDETVRNYDYTASQGRQVTIEDVTISPEQVAPGGTVNIRMTYAVLTPSAGGQTVTEIREIRHGSELVGRMEKTVTHQSDGTYTSRVPITLPTAADEGAYEVRGIVQADVTKAMRQAKFVVAK